MEKESVKIPSYCMTGGDNGPYCPTLGEFGMWNWDGAGKGDYCPDCVKDMNTEQFDSEGWTDPEYRTTVMDDEWEFKWGPEKPLEYDPMVENPDHYTLPGGMQVIDLIEFLLTPEEFLGYLKGSSLKYALRADKKGENIQDREKMNKFNSWVIERLKEQK